MEGEAPSSPPESVGDVAAAREARCLAARALALAFLDGPRWCRLPVAGVEVGAADVEVLEEVEGGGRASSSSMANLTCVALPLLVERVKVADLPALLTEWNMSIKAANSPSIFVQESEQMCSSEELRKHVLSLSIALSSIAKILFSVVGTWVTFSVKLGSVQQTNSSQLLGR